MKISRRKLLKHLSSWPVLAAPGIFWNRSANAKACAQLSSEQVTPDLPLGPFHPLLQTVKAHNDFDQDLTQIKGNPESAKGEIIIIQGTVKNNFCEPVTDANIEIWQACASGRYNHPGEYYTVPQVDPNFQYMAQIATDADGKYKIKTVVPGAYPLSETNWRAPHVHFHVSHRKHYDLITQMFFAGQPYNKNDGVLRPLTPEGLKKIVQESIGKDKDGHKIYQFDIVQRKLPWTKITWNFIRQRYRISV